MKRLIIKWALKQIRKLYKKGVGWDTLKKYGIRDILHANYSDRELLIAIREFLKK